MTTHSRQRIAPRVAPTALALLTLTSLSGPALAKTEWTRIDSWVYQLTKYKDAKLDQIAESPFDLAVVDLARDGGDDYFTRDEIQHVQDKSKFVLAYFEIGAIENYRPEWDNVPDDLKAGPVSGWPKEQYVKFWDERWWPVVKGRLDRALEAGFDGAYLDMVTTYEEIPIKAIEREELARRMVALIVRVSSYAKGRNPNFRIVPQNSPELYTWSFWDGPPNQEYLNAIDGIGLESVFYLAHDKPADKAWCKENRGNALAIKNAGKLAFGIDYAKTPFCIADAYSKQRAIGFIPYVSVVSLDVVLLEGETKATPPEGKAPTRKKKGKRQNK